MRAVITLHLVIHAVPGRRDALLAFLRKAKPYYESPGGIRMKLLESRDDPDAMIEVFEYDSVEVYEQDEHRVEHDETMKELLAEWRTFLARPPRVETFRHVQV